jgi:multicomponent Na+:H+ antiporter subunit A
MIASRSPIVRLGVQAAGPLALVVAVYLFFAGHNQPGGGFAAGLVLGAVVALRTVAGFQRPTRAVGLLAAGGLLAGAVALAPVVGGEVLLDQVVVKASVPVLGTVKAGTALLFDLGVSLVVVGLVVAVLEGLGAVDLARAAGPPVSEEPG